VLQLELFAQGKRGGSSYAHVMAHVAPRASEAQRRDVASYYASLSTDTTEAMRDPE
jgi:cytochrome c553